MKSFFLLSLIILISTNCINRKWISGNNWKLQTNAVQSEIFNIDTLKFRSCNNCYADDVLASRPQIRFQRFLYNNREGYKSYFQKKIFEISFDIKLDSLTRSVDARANIIGKWKLKGSRNAKIILNNVDEYIWEKEGEPALLKAKKGKIIYSLLVLNNNEMILIRKANFLKDSL